MEGKGSHDHQRKPSKNCNIVYDTLDQCDVSHVTMQRTSRKSAQKCTSTLKMAYPQMVGPIVILWLIQFITGKYRNIETGRSYFLFYILKYKLGFLLFFNLEIELLNDIFNYTPKLIVSL